MENLVGSKFTMSHENNCMSNLAADLRSSACFHDPIVLPSTFHPTQ